MLFNFNFYSSLLLITFSQGLIYSVLLSKKGFQSSTNSNYLLSFFVLLCSLYVAPWMLGFAGWYDQQPYRDFMFYVPFQQLFLIGPTMFFYVQSLLNPAFRLNKKQFLHFLPAILYNLYNLWIFVYDKIILNDYYYYRDGADKDFDQWYQISGQIFLAFYFILSLLFYNRYRKLVVQITSNADAVLFKWIRTYLIAFLAMVILPVVFDFIKMYIPSNNEYENSWWFYLVYSVILYYIAITGYSNSVTTKIGFEMSIIDKKPILLLQKNTESTVEQNIIDIEYQAIKDDSFADLEFWKTKIETLINHQKSYENPELTLTDIATQLKTNPAMVSKTINQGFGMNFNDFINNYRIEAVKAKFRDNEHKKSTLLGIAFDCGFNSKATFNRAFKKNTGTTPKDYLQALK